MIFKKGDKVYDYAYGWGEVYDINEVVDYYPLLIEFQHIKLYYNFKGVSEFGLLPTLSFTEYTLEGFSQVRPKEELPFDRWYVDDRFPAFICFYGTHKTYGLSYAGDWSIWKGVHVPDGNYKLATDEQILEKLSAYAASIGVKAAAKFKEIGGYYSIMIEEKPIVGFKYVKAMNALYFNNWLMMQDGKWVTVVVEQNSYIESKATGKWREFIEQRKTLEEEIQAIKKHLGI